MLTNLLSLISSSDPMVCFSVVVSLAAMITAFVILGLALVFQRLTRRRRQHRERFRALWNLLLIQSLVEIPQSLPALNHPGETRLFLESWTYVRESMRGDAVANLDQVMRLVGADHAARRLLRSSSLADRLVAVVALGHLGERSVWEELHRLVASRWPELSLASARALVLIDAPAALGILTPFLGSRSDWSFTKVADMLNEAGPETAARALAQAVPAVSTDEATRMVHCLEATGSPSALPAVRNVFAREEADEQLMIACLRYFSRCGGPEELPLVRACLSHSNWLIRLHAVIALGKVGTRDDVPPLIERLEDEQWWVRYRAAEALAGLPFVGLDRLLNIQMEHPDQLTRDILASFTLVRWSRT